MYEIQKEHNRNFQPITFLHLLLRNHYFIDYDNFHSFLLLES